MADIGRPTVMTPETINKLEEAFSNGASDKEAIFLANISSATFYAYCQENPDFSERKEALKDMIKYKARMNIARAVETGDRPMSQWYLERKVKEEFSPRGELTGALGVDLIPNNSAEIKAITEKLNEIYRSTGISSDGGATNAVDTEA